MLTLHVCGLRKYNGKIVNVKSWNILRGKKGMVPILVWWDTLDYLVERNNIRYRFLFLFELFSRDPARIMIMP